jgi:hypothetical protein
MQGYRTQPTTTRRTLSTRYLCIVDPSNIQAPAFSQPQGLGGRYFYPKSARGYATKNTTSTPSLYTYPDTSAMNKKQKHTTGGIPRWSPTLVLVARFSAYVWQSGRDAQFSLTYGRMYVFFRLLRLLPIKMRALSGV